MKSIFLEYTTLRQSGEDRHSALQHLNTSLEQITADEKSILAEHLHRWEADNRYEFSGDSATLDGQEKRAGGGFVIRPLKSMNEMYGRDSGAGGRATVPQERVVRDASPWKDEGDVSAYTIQKRSTAPEHAGGGGSAWREDDTTGRERSGAGSVTLIDDTSERQPVSINSKTLDAGDSNGRLKSVPVQPADQGTARWVQCAFCGAKNRINEVFCFTCGRLMSVDENQFETQTFGDASEDMYSDSYFSHDSVLMLLSRYGSAPLEIRPQQSKTQLIIGRYSGGKSAAPDIDLTDHHAVEKGVSRLHAALRYLSHDEMVQVNDLGSVNGTFINGHRMHPSEVRILRHKDELRLGHLVLRVLYRHPGAVIRLDENDD